MSRTRRTFAPEFKAQVVLELVRGEKTAAELCRVHNLGPDLLSQWKQVLVERAVELYTPATTRSEEATRIAELEQLVGQQAMELAILKKAGIWSRARSWTSGR